MSEVTEYGTRNAEDGLLSGGARHDGRRRGSWLSGFGASVATLVSIIALVFSGYSFYETVLKQSELRFYPPPMVTMYRESFRDVFAIPVTLSNDGAQRGTVLSFDLTVEHRESGDTMQFQNLHYGASPKDSDKRMFTPITVTGRDSFSGVVLFHALKTGSFVSTTGGVQLPLRFTLSLNVDRARQQAALPEWLEWTRQLTWLPSLTPEVPAPITFDMTANYIAGMRDMEAGRATQLHDNRWFAAGTKAD